MRWTKDKKHTTRVRDGETNRRPASSAAARLSPVLKDLMGERARYEALRSSGGSFAERAASRERLHRLRAEMAAIRPNGL